MLSYFDQETLWFIVVLYDLCLAIFLYRFFGKYGLYCAVILGIVLGNLQGGKISQLDIFGYQLNVSMGAILYSGIYFATDLLNEKYGKRQSLVLGFNDIENDPVLINHYQEGVYEEIVEFINSIDTQFIFKVPDDMWY